MFGAANAQMHLGSLTYEQCNDISKFKRIPNKTTVEKYITSNGMHIKVGDTLILGTPTGGGQIAESTVASNGLRNYKSYETMIMGKVGGFGNVMGALNGDSPLNTPASFKGTNVIVKKMIARHKRSRRTPLRIEMRLGEINGKAFGMNKYISALDYERATELGELKSIHTPLTRSEAIAKLKESKELLDLGLYTQVEYDVLKTELSKIIMK
jgi:hypothetical protein